MLSITKLFPYRFRPRINRGLNLLPESKTIARELIKKFNLHHSIADDLAQGVQHCYKRAQKSPGDTAEIPLINRATAKQVGWIVLDGPTSDDRSWAFAVVIKETNQQFSVNVKGRRVIQSMFTAGSFQEGEDHRFGAGIMYALQNFVISTSLLHKGN